MEICPEDMEDGLRLPSSRERMATEARPISRLELDKAVRDLALGKAPGLDRFPASLYLPSPVLRVVLELLSNAILREG